MYQYQAIVIPNPIRITAYAWCTIPP
jgi:hypothetical protein